VLVSAPIAVPERLDPRQVYALTESAEVLLALVDRTNRAKERPLEPPFTWHGFGTSRFTWPRTDGRGGNYQLDPDVVVEVVSPRMRIFIEWLPAHLGRAEEWFRRRCSRYASLFQGGERSGYRQACRGGLVPTVLVVRYSGGAVGGRQVELAGLKQIADTGVQVQTVIPRAAAIAVMDLCAGRRIAPGGELHLTAERRRQLQYFCDAAIRTIQLARQQVRQLAAGQKVELRFPEYPDNAQQVLALVGDGR
jgi:hypothetical protein